VKFPQAAYITLVYDHACTHTHTHTHSLNFSLTDCLKTECLPQLIPGGGIKTGQMKTVNGESRRHYYSIISE